MNCKPDTKWRKGKREELWKCKRNENVFKVTTTTRAANLHNPEQQIVTNWKLFSAKIVSDCLCKPSPLLPSSPSMCCQPLCFIPFQFQFASPIASSSCHCYNQSSTNNKKNPATEIDSQAIWKPATHTQREADTDTDRMEEHSRRYVARVQTKKYRQVWRFMALFSAAHFAKNVFQLSHNCAICRVFYESEEGRGRGAWSDTNLLTEALGIRWPWHFFYTENVRKVWVPA